MCARGPQAARLKIEPVKMIRRITKCLPVFDLGRLRVTL
jgi:hypothetical protein